MCGIKRQTACSSIVWSAKDVCFNSCVEWSGSCLVVPSFCEVERQFECGAIIVWRGEVVGNLLCGLIVVWSGKWHCHVVQLLCGVGELLPCGSIMCGVERLLPCGSIVWNGEMVAMKFHSVEWRGSCYVVPSLCGVVRWLP